MEKKLYKPFKPGVASFYTTLAAMLAVLSALPRALHSATMLWLYEAIILIAFVTTVVLSFILRPKDGTKPVKQWYLLPLCPIYVYLVAFPFYQNQVEMMTTIGSVLIELTCVVAFVQTLCPKDGETTPTASENPWNYVVLNILLIVMAMGNLA